MLCVLENAATDFKKTCFNHKLFEENKPVLRDQALLQIQEKSQEAINGNNKPNEVKAITGSKRLLTNEEQQLLLGLLF